jgi:peroxiredoxin
MTQTNNSVRTDTSTLAEQTTQARDEFIASLPPDQQQTLGAAFEKLMASDVGDNAINVGDEAPDFELPGVLGGVVQLSTQIKQGPVVLNFYRGGWCPFCNLEFRALQQRLPEIKALGATLIGISPETPDASLSTIEKHHLEFEVLSDVGNLIAARYGLLMQVYEELRPLYLQWGLDIPAVNGDDRWEMPVPATYVIDSEGKVRSGYVNKDYTQRMEPEDIVAALRTMGQ